jgi:hypothetical protein
MHSTADQPSPASDLVTPSLAGTPCARSGRRVLAPILVTWMWGAAGAPLGVSMLASFRIYCDHAAALQPIGVMLGR